MKKRLLSALLCSVMVMSLFACGSSSEDETTKANGGTTAGGDATSSSEAESGTTTVKPVTDTAEDITKDPIYFEDFEDEDLKLSVVYHNNYNEDTGAPGVAGTMPTVDDAVAAGKTAILEAGASANGSQAIFLDGTYGAILDCTFAGDTPSYTVSFWINEKMLGLYGTMLTIGKDLLSTNNDTAWINITRTEWLGYQTVPTIWSRSMEASLEVDPTGDADGNGTYADNVWPWYAEAYCFMAEENRVTKDTWHMITVVVDGTVTGRDPVLETDVAGTVQGTTYIDGQLWGVGPVANYIVDDQTQLFLGINAWDPVTCAYYDDIAVYDYALTAGQVFGLFNAQKGE